MKKFLAAALLVIFAFYVFCVHYTEAYQVGVMWNRLSGSVELDQQGGFTLTPPWVSVARIDLRPARVCIASTARSYNCKLVKFEPTAFREFVALQGFHYYWFANRVSFNSGYESYRGMKDIMRGYAFSEKQYKFLVVTGEYKSDNN